jgi:hypothetical protein
MAAIISVDDVVVGESDEFAEFIIRLNAAVDFAVSVNYTTAGSSASSGSDYVFTPGSLTFAPGETVKTVQVPIVANTVPERTESFFFNLSNPVNAMLGTSHAVATIIDDDAATGKPLMAISDLVIDEKSGEAHFTITLDQPSSHKVSVTYGTEPGTAGDTDFTATSGDLRFAPGEMVKTVSVPITDDKAREPDEKFDLVLSGVAGAILPDPVGTATIWSSDQATTGQPTISVGDLQVGEQDAFAEFLIRLSAPSTLSVSVSYNIGGGGTAASNQDYGFTQGSLTFAPGESLKTVRVPIFNDTAPESAETFYFNLFSPSNAVLGNTRSMATIIDNDAVTGKPVVAISDPVIDETSGEARFAITLDRPSGRPVSVAYRTRPGSAGGDDFSAARGVLSFAPGETVKTVSVSILNDKAREPDEKFALVLSNASAATLPDPVGTATIGSSDQPTAGQPAVSVGDVRIGEPDGAAEFVISLSAPSNLPVSVHYATQPSTATVNVDFGFTSGILSFAPGETEKTVQVSIVNDALAETDETFLLNLSGPVNATIGDGTAVATIFDDETHPAILSYGSSDDTYLVKRSDTIILESADGGIDTVQASARFALPDFVENLILTDATAIRGSGNSLDNNITGSSANNSAERRRRKGRAQRRRGKGQDQGRRRQ